MKMKEIEKGEGKKENVKENKWKIKIKEKGAIANLAVARFAIQRYS